MKTLLFVLASLLVSSPALARLRTYEDQVMQLGPQGNVDEVLFRYRAAFYYLKKDQANYVATRRSLQASMLQKKSIRFVVDTNLMEIKEVLTEE